MGTEQEVRRTIAIINEPSSLDLALKPSGTIKAKAGRKTHDTMLHNLNSNPRVTKSRILRRDPDVHKNTDAIDFESQMKAYTSGLMFQLEQNLNDAEHELKECLENLVIKLSSQCNMMERAGGVLLRSLADERLAVVDSKNPQKRNEVSLHDRMHAFKVEVDKKKRILGQLWIEWNQVQKGMVYLIVEIFGKGAVEVDENDVPTEICNAIEAASSQREEVSKQHNSVQDLLSDIKERANQLSTNTKRDLEAQLKQISLADRRRARVMNKAIKEYLGDDE